MSRVGLLVAPGDRIGVSAARVMLTRVESLYVAGVSSIAEWGAGVTRSVDVKTVDLDIDDSDSWASVMAGIAREHGELTYLVVGRHESVRDDIFSLDGPRMRHVARRNLLAPWLALKHGLPILSGEAAAVVVLIPLSTDAGRTFQVAEHSALTIMTDAAVLDGAQLGIRARINRLKFCPDSVADGDLRDALTFLLSEQSAFMTGAELTLSGSRVP